MKTLILILSFLLIQSCTSEKKILDSWIGKTKKDLYLKAGPPTFITSDGDGGECLIYSITITSLTGNYFYKNTLWYIDNSGKVYHWITQQGTIPPQRLDVRLYVR